jgi:SAM-dependent methyltransferase
VAAKPEWMDSPEVNPAEMALVLGDLARLNRLFGGSASILDTLWPMLADAREFSVLDVAAGDGFLLRELARRAWRDGLSFRGLALEINPAVITVARQSCSSFPTIQVEMADGLALPHATDSFDFVISSLALHHFGPERAETASREMNRVARRGWIVSDLRRSRTGYALTWLAVRALRCRPITRHDGPISIQCAFTRPEYLKLIRRLGIPGVRYRERLWFRSILSARA